MGIFRRPRESSAATPPAISEFWEWWAQARPTLEASLAASGADPEDAGGPYGYAGLLATLADPGHPDHEEMRDWVGRPFDPSGFDPYRATVLLRRMV